MAIPITCPGCQAGFEVPETLAGKTIRCTSCKTQLSVPAAGANKPFGWAGAAAKPAAKAAPARAAVAVDDDDDDRKTSPAKSASKNGPTIKGAIKSGSKHRDDDDDDDDDDRPRRRKNSKGAGAGGGAMLALIGGGVLCLGAIVGLSVWLLSDDGEKDTAKTENKTNNAAPVTPTGGPGNPGNTGRDDRTGGGNGNGNEGAAAPDDSQGGGFAMKPGGRRGPNTGGAPPPGGGGINFGGGNNPFTDWGQINNDSLGTPGPWAKHDGDGFSAEFPGTPGNRDMSANGMTMKITAVGGKSQPVAAVMMLQLPAAAQLGNPRELISQIKAGISAQSGKPARDVTVSGFPGVEANVADGSGGGTMRLVLARDRLYMFIAGGENKGGRPVMPKEDVTRFLNSATISYKGDSGNFAGGEQPGPGSLGGPPTPGGGFGGPPPGGGFGGPPTPGGGFGGPPPGGIGIPQPPAGGPGGGAGAPVGEGAIPGGFQPPPGAGGGPGGLRPGGLGQPPAGGLGGPGGIGGGGQRPGGGGLGGFGGGLDTNPAPFGASTEGNMKANVEPFFAGAFDNDKKEFFTFSSRVTGSQIANRLNRFNVAANFAKAGSFKVPNLATRAVLDPAKGLIYVATINRPSIAALEGQRFDQAVGVGDVQIFDLTAIRDGKVKDGADLRPIATIGVGRNIRGLELSADGKSLFVVSSTTGKTPKSFLAVYDTETRKPSTEAKTLDRAAWDMCKAPDGKHLLIVDMVESGSASSARLVDMATLTEVKSLNLQGAANDVAATSGGHFAAPVSVNGSIKLVVATDKGTRDLDLGVGWKAAAKPGYVEFSSDGKTLFVSGHPAASGSYARQGQPAQAAGLDVYEVTDADAPNGVKKKASIRTAGGHQIGGHFLMSPDSDFLVFHTGVVVETANVGGNNGEGTVGGGLGGPPGPGAAGGAFPPQPGAGGVQPPPAGGGLSPEEQLKRRQGGGVQPGPGGGGVQPGPGGPGGPPPGLDEQMKRRQGGGVQPGPGGGGGVQPPPKGGSDLEEQMKRRGGQVQPGPNRPGG